VPASQQADPAVNESRQEPGGVNFTPPFPTELPDGGAKGLMGAANEYALRLRAFYNARAIWHRRFYRLSGMLVILAGAGLPVLANLDYPGKSTVVSLAGMAVAVLTALHAFYRWDQSWILLRHTEGALTAAYWAWRLDVPVDTPADDKDAIVRTKAFLALLAQIRDEESLTFFKGITFPAATTTHSGGR
jgi:uncharacterized protein DUF4231